MPIKDAPDYEKTVRPELEKHAGGKVAYEHVAIVVTDSEGVDKIILVEVKDGVEIFGYHRDPRAGKNEKDWQLWPRGSKLVGR